MKRASTILIAIMLLLSGVALPVNASLAPSVAQASTYTHITITTADSVTNIVFGIKGAHEKHVVKGKKLKLKTKGPLADITWKSSNKKVATVSDKGVVKGKKAGKAIITATSISTGASTTCTVKVYAKRTQAQVRKAVLALQKKYPEGKRWTNANHYYWDAANANCYGCIAFVGIASDKAFGKYAPLKQHAKLGKIKAGDHIRIGGWHSVIVLYKKANSVVVAEGNYNSSIHWNREITFAELKREGYKIWTRY